MNFVGDSLGVNCDHCHVKGEKNPQTGEDTWLWEREDKKEKAVGRDMMRMVLELNRARFNREAVVTCYTYHRGSTRPERMAPLPPRDYYGEALKPQPKTRVANRPGSYREVSLGRRRKPPGHFVAGNHDARDSRKS